MWEADVATGTLRLVRIGELPHFPGRLVVGGRTGPFGLLVVTNFPSIYTLDDWKS